MAPTVEEMLRTSTLLTPPKRHQSIESLSRKLDEAKKSCANPKASSISIPPDWPAPTEGEFALGRFLVGQLDENPQLIQAVNRYSEIVGRIAETARPFFEGLSTFVEHTAPVLEEFLKPTRLHPVEIAAHEALGALMEGRMQDVETFLSRWLRIHDPDPETHEALMRVLGRRFKRPLGQLGNPAAWLREAVKRSREGIIAERDQVDTYSKRLAQVRAAEEDAYHAPGKTFYLPPRTSYVPDPEDRPDPFVRPKNTGMRPPSAEDPYLLVPAKHGSWRQAVEELANSGRRPTRERARLTLEYRQELEDREIAFSRKEWLRRIGGAHAERALKKAAKEHHKKILGGSE